MAEDRSGLRVTFVLPCFLTTFRFLTTFQGRSSIIFHIFGVETDSPFVSLQAVKHRIQAARRTAVNDSSQDYQSPVDDNIMSLAAVVYSSRLQDFVCRH
jgi:hypothetical protein